MPYTTLSSSPSSPQFHRLHLLHDDTTLAEITPYNRPTTPPKRVRAAGPCAWLDIGQPPEEGVVWLFLKGAAVGVVVWGRVARLSSGMGAADWAVLGL
ncbi:hypothetical protein Tco_1048429 [Tanacetum coccineum]